MAEAIEDMEPVIKHVFLTNEQRRKFDSLVPGKMESRLVVRVDIRGDVSRTDVFSS